MHPPRSRTDQDVTAARRVLDARDSRPELARLTRLAARLLGVASAQVSLLTDVQTIVAGAGLPPELVDGATPLSDSLCTVTASCGSTLMVADARADSRVSSLPPVRSGAVGSYLGVPLTVDDGAVVGALCVFDSSPHTWSPEDAVLLEQLAESAAAELELASLSGELEAGRARWELAIDAAGIGSFDLDVETWRLTCDDTMLALFGWDAADVPTLEAFRERVHPDDLPRVTQAIQDAADGAGTYTAEFRLLLPSGEVRWIDVRGRALADTAGKAVCLVGAVSDATARRDADAGVVRVLELSARVGQEISSSLDVEDAASKLARAVVPRLADWALVSLVDDGGTVRDVASWHAVPAMRPVLHRYTAARLGAVGDRGAVNEALASADPVVIPSGATAAGLRTLTAPAVVDALTELAPESAVVLPLAARGHLVGVLSLCRGPERSPMTDHEMPIAVSVAERAGLAIDNIRLYDHQRSTAQQLLEANSRLQAVAEHERTVALALQDAMLTRLPEPDHLHLVARYLTATGTEQVGGDWYDALVLPGGATMVMIGDVAGHDITAAATMGQLRNMLRAFAWDHPEDPPSTTVNRLDRAVRDLALGTFATLVLLQVEQEPVDRARGMRELRWSNAGHPPPILLHADGSAATLDTAHDLLIGAAPEFARHDHTHAAPPGSTLILYTDGLIETRTADIDAGQARLLDSLRRHHRLPTRELLDAVVVEMVGSHPDDDVAILAVRFHPEDRERPAEAGPRRD